MPVASNEKIKSHSSSLKIPLYFEPNQDQSQPEVKFLARGRGHTLFLTAEGATHRFEVAQLKLSGAHHAGRSTSSPGEKKYSQLKMKLVGANPCLKLQGIEALPGRNNYYLGNDPRRWKTGVSMYSQVKQPDLYPGIDLIYYGNEQQLEFDFVLAPGADPGLIRMGFEGAKAIQLSDQGDLVLKVDGGTLVQHKPKIYQQIEGKREIVPGDYVLKGSDQVGFRVSTYDSNHVLIIDPVLSYATYLGTSDWDTGQSIGIDPLGNVYVTGVTAPASLLHDDKDAVFLRGDVFVAKLSPDLSKLLYFTHLGGNDEDFSSKVAVDASGNAYVTGYTSSGDFPTMNAFQSKQGGGVDAFVAKLNADGTLSFSTFLGGDSTDRGAGIAVDHFGNAFVAGTTFSDNFPTSHPFQGARSKGIYGYDAFVSKLSPDGSSLIYSTYLGGSSYDEATSVAVDLEGNAYVTGDTGSGNFPRTPQAFDRTCGSDGKCNPYGFFGLETRSDAFVTKLDPMGTRLLYSTYLGGSKNDGGVAISVDKQGNAYVTGYTGSTDFPTLNALQKGSPNGGGFVAKLSADGSSLIYSTYLSETGRGTDIVVDAEGYAYVLAGVGLIDSWTVLSAELGGSNIGILKLMPSGSSLAYSAVLGATGDNSAGGMAVDSSGNIYLAGTTNSSFFPTSSASLQPWNAGRTDAFIAKIASAGEPVQSIFVPIVLSSSGANNSHYTSELTLTNRGKQGVTLKLTYTAAFGGGSGSTNSLLTGGQQRILPDAISYLRSLGLPIPESGDRGGTLSIQFSGVYAAEIGATVRTTTAVEGGRAGLAYAGIPRNRLLKGPSYLCGLRQTGADRSHVAVQNAGASSDGKITLRATVFSGDAASPGSWVLPDITLLPGGFQQINEILHSNGLSFSNGYVRIDRVVGRAAYYAYAVINDQGTSDGSFVAPIPESALTGKPSVTVPVVVETPKFKTELVLTNWSMVQKILNCQYVVNGFQFPDATARFQLTIKPREQLILPNLVQSLRDRGIAGVKTTGVTYAGSLSISDSGNDMSGIFAGARTSSAASEGQFGVFYPAVPSGWASSGEAWLYGLRQDSECRTNLALVNTGEVDPSLGGVFNVELYDGSTGTRVTTLEGLTLKPREWLQLPMVLAHFATNISNAYARVIQVGGPNPFIAYAVINDGASPGERTGDGAFVASTP